MREIKFRGRDRNEWYYGYYLKEGNTHYIIEKGRRYKVIPETVGQYTGLRDKTGKEIYEGDIINGRWIEGDDDDFNYYEDLIVRYDDEFGVFTVKEIPKPPYENYVNFLYQLRDIEVIGSIHDNSELQRR